MSEILLLLRSLLILLVIIEVFLIMANFLLKNKQEVNEDDYVFNSSSENTKQKKNYGKFHGELTRGQIKDFLAFDEIKDGMIIRSKCKQYIMVIQCFGVNYDLSSDQDKIVIEEGFLQFLNVLKFPIQLYVQTRMVNFADIINNYTERANIIRDDLNETTAKLDEAKLKGDEQLYNELVYERRRKENMFEYANDAIATTVNMSSNKNVLQRKNYIVVSYNKDELGTRSEKYSQEEILNLVYNELLTRCRTLIEALGGSMVSGKVMNSEELIELVFAAYNRDDTEFIQISNYLASEYDEFYAVSKDVFEKKKELMEKEIDINAINLVTESIISADKERRKELLELRKNRINKTREKSVKHLEKYKDNLLDNQTYEKAKKNILNAKITETEEGNLDIQINE